MMQQCEILKLKNLRWAMHSFEGPVWTLEADQMVETEHVIGTKLCQEHLYILFMYSLALLLSSIYPLPAMHSLLVTLYVTEYSVINYLPRWSYHLLYLKSIGKNGRSLMLLKKSSCKVWIDRNIYKINTFWIEHIDLSRNAKINVT